MLYCCYMLSYSYVLMTHAIYDLDICIQLWDRCDTSHSLICFLFWKAISRLANAGFSLALPKGASCSWSRCGVLVAQPSFCEDVDSGFFFLTSKQLLRWEHTGIHQGPRMILFSCHHHSSASKQKEPHNIHITICHVTNWKTLKDWKTSIQEQNPSVPARTCHYRLQLRNFQWLSWGWCRPRPKILTHPTS